MLCDLLFMLGCLDHSGYFDEKGLENRTRVEVGRPVTNLWQKIQARHNTDFDQNTNYASGEKWSDSQYFCR